MLQALALVGLTLAEVPQMNPGVKYMVSNPHPGSNNTNGFRGKFFEVETDLIKSQYSQVNWHPVPDVPLPADVISAFDGKVMVVTGWEVDVLRPNPQGGPPQPVPCWESYNHHYVSHLSGKGADVSVRMPQKEDPTPSTTHGGPQFIFTDNGKGDGTGYPTSQAFSEHNGNEARQSYHSVAKGYGVPIESPTAFSFCPMQINTRNPDGSGTRCNGNCPLPRRQNAWKNASWAGILECPCTTRMVKTFDHRTFVGASGCTWNSTVTDQAECFASAASETKGKIARNSTVASAAKPFGCSVEGATAVFNTAAASTAGCEGTTCVCRAETGWINGNRFTGGCMGEPLSDLIKTHNPTCDINLYDGGLSCCGNMISLLDHDQPLPALEDAVYYKWRFYYEELAAPTPQKETFHIEWQFGKIEYSVPKAPEGTPADKAVHTLTTRFSMNHWLGAQCGGAPQCSAWSNNNRPVELIMAGFHCHSPGCLGGKLFNADTGEELCHVKPQAGTGLAAKDEENYLWLPPCQWGSAEEGLLAPPVLPVGTNLTSIKWANSSVAHSGVMAIWQGRAAYAN